MEHSFDGSSCNNPDCGKHHMKIHRRYKCRRCGNILHPAPLGCSQAVNDDGAIECLPGKGCNSHAGLPSVSASVTGSSLLQQSALHFQPTRPPQRTASSEDDEDAKMPAATLPSSTDLATGSHIPTRDTTQGIPTVARARSKGKKHGPRNSMWTRVDIDSEIWYAACKKYTTMNTL